MRNHALDAYRGFVMLLMMAEVLQLGRIATAFPGNPFWSFLGYNQTHVEWAGCSLHDMIQPSFSFLVGVALPYSIAKRMRNGARFPKMLAHAIWRSFLLTALGIFLRSMHSPQTNFTFEDTLTQIGLGYTFLFLLAYVSPLWQRTAFVTILFFYWLAWALYPAEPGYFTGFASHWNKNTNLGSAFDLWFLNLFPRPQSFVANSGGYLTLSFIPTLATMILGLMAGRWIVTSAPRKRFVVIGVLCLGAGLLLHFTGICPIVKRIWTPAWTLFSGGVCLLFLAAFRWLLRAESQPRWAFPLIVIGTNSIAAYLIAHLCEDFLKSSFLINLGHSPFQLLGPALEPLLLGIALLISYWLMLWWMYRNRVFLKI